MTYADERRIVIKKLDIAANPHLTAKMEDYTPGKNLGLTSVPINYEIEGYLIDPMLLGNVVRVHRFRRNNVAAEGLFETTPVTELTNSTFKTANSIYKYEYLQTAAPL